MINKHFVIVQTTLLFAFTFGAQAQVQSRFDKKQTIITEIILSTSDDKELESLSFERLKEKADKKENSVNVVEL